MLGADSGTYFLFREFQVEQLIYSFFLIAFSSTFKEVDDGICF